jgi:ribosomal protein L19E
LAKLDERKRLVLETMQRLSRPIWAGDVAAKAVDQELFRMAFRALVDEGKIVRKPGAKGDRAYYYFD